MVWISLGLSCLEIHPVSQLCSFMSFKKMWKVFRHIPLSVFFCSWNFNVSSFVIVPEVLEAPFIDPGRKIFYRCWAEWEFWTLRPLQITTLAGRDKSASLLLSQWPPLTPRGGRWPHYNWAVVKILTLHCSSDTTHAGQSLKTFSSRTPASVCSLHF